MYFYFILLSYNLHTTKFTFLKWIWIWFCVLSPLSALVALALPFRTVHVSLDTMDGPQNCALCPQGGWQRTLSLLAGELTFFFGASVTWSVSVGRSDCLCCTKCPLASKAPFGYGLQCSLLWTDWPCEAQWTGFCHSGQLHLQHSRWAVNPGGNGIYIFLIWYFIFFLFIQQVFMSDLFPTLDI